MSRMVVGRLKYISDQRDRQRDVPYEASERWLDSNFLKKSAMRGEGLWAWTRMSATEKPMLEEVLSLEGTRSDRYRFEGVIKAESERIWSACEL